MAILRRDVTGVRSVLLCDWGELVLSQGQPELLTVEADPQILERMGIEVNGSELRLQVGRDLPEGLAAGLHTSATRPEIRYTLRLSDLNRLSVAGFAQVRVEALTTTTLELEVNGIAQVTLAALKAQRFTVNQHGSGHVVAVGQAAEQTVTILGAGQYDAERLQTNQAIVTLHGAGRARVWVDQELEVTSVGVGLVEYRGHPFVQRRGTGLGVVRPLG